MDGRSATYAALGVAILAIVAFFVLDGVVAGLVLFVAGVILVVIGIFGWQDRRPALAAAVEGSTGGAVDEPTARVDRDDDAGESRRTLDAPTAALGGSRGALDPDDGPRDDDRRVGEPDDGRDVVTGAATNEDDGGDAEPAGEEAPAPHPVVAEAEAVADPLGVDRTESVLDADRADDDADAGLAAAPPTMQLTEDGAGHVHDQPLLGHGDLVAHVRDYHPDVPSDGSTIQLRLLHERQHGAPHETPVTIRPVT